MCELRQRRPRVRNDAFLAYLRKQPCVVCGKVAPSEAAHLRMARPEIGKESTGLGRKPDDKFCTSLCHNCHAEQHRRGEGVWWGIVGLDPFKRAGELYSAFVAQSGRDAGCQGNGTHVRGVVAVDIIGCRRIKRSTVSHAKAMAATGPKRQWPPHPLKSASRWPKRKVRS